MRTLPGSRRAHAQSFVYAEQTIDATIAFNNHLVKRRMGARVDVLTTITLELRQPLTAPVYLARPRGPLRPCGGRPYDQRRRL
jgi:hypothetical protein